MSTTIRLLKEDRERLEKLAKKTGSRKLIEALRFALSAAEREADEYRGNPKSISNALKFARPEKGSVIPENIDDKLADALYEEIKEEEEVEEREH